MFLSKPAKDDILVTTSLEASVKDFRKTASAPAPVETAVSDPRWPENPEKIALPGPQPVKPFQHCGSYKKLSGSHSPGSLVLLCRMEKPRRHFRGWDQPTTFSQPFPGGEEQSSRIQQMNKCLSRQESFLVKHHASYGIKGRRGC